MNISQDFINAVAENDLMMVRIMLKNSMVFDPTFAEFGKLLSYAETNMDNLYDEHDGELFITDMSKWNEDYMASQMTNIIENFSKERVAFLKTICGYLLKEKAEKIEAERMEAKRMKEKATKARISQKQVGSGLVAAGAVTAVVGLAVSKPAVVGVGIVAAVAGGIMIATNK